MLHTTRWAGAVVTIGTLNLHPALAQQPAQFKATVRMQDGSDGSKSSGVMYFGGAKMRLEIAKDGENIIVLTDPATKTQYILMPSEKMYMQMPIGQGPVSSQVTGGTDPTNPCSGGSGATDCLKGPTEAVNGYETVRWDYTAKDGTRTRAWISPKLRFPIKTTDDNGSSTEFSNIAEGAQAASLFAIPAGYSKMDVGAMGGMGAAGGRGRGRANSGDPMAAAMSNMSPEAAAAMAAAMRGDVSKGAMGPTGSAWEKGNGWLLTLTINATAVTNRDGEMGTNRETYTTRYVASIPLNYGSPAVGVPGAPGPMWTHMAADGMGSAEALALPLSLAVESEARTESGYKGACGIAEDPFTAVGTMKASAQRSVPIKQPSTELRAQAVFKLSGDLKTYNLLAGVGMLKAKEVTQTRVEKKGCRDGALHVENKSESRDVEYGVPAIEVNGLPLPRSVSPISGSKKMPVRLGAREFDATVSWTLTPIR